MSCETPTWRVMGTDVFNHASWSPRQLNKYKYNETELTACGFGAYIFPFRGNSSQLGYLKQLLSHERERYRLNWKCSSMFKIICSKQTYYTIIDEWCFSTVGFVAKTIVSKINMKRTLFIYNALIAKKNTHCLLLCPSVSLHAVQVFTS